MKQGERVDLSGVRLGVLERSLLLAASAPTLPTGMLIVAPEGTRSAQEGYLRAASKLERVGLLDRTHVPQARRAHDPRREAPVYWRGRFGIREDPTRRHIVRRVAVWASPFGERIRTVYRRELKAGRPIRWDPRVIAAAFRYAQEHPVVPYHRKRHVDAMAGYLTSADDGKAKLVEAHPESVLTQDDLERWHLAILVARRCNPTVGSAALWNAACEVLESDRTTEDLREATGTTALREARRSLPRLFDDRGLGMMVPMDPDLRRQILGLGGE